MIRDYRDGQDVVYYSSNAFNRFHLLLLDFALLLI